MKPGQFCGTLVASVLLLALPWAVAAQEQKDTTQPSSANAASAKQTATASDQKAGDKSAQKAATGAPMTPSEARQAQLVADTERLYQLTQELKAEVAKSNKDTLSIAVVKKAAEVEKLAKSLKERMRA